MEDFLNDFERKREEILARHPGSFDRAAFLVMGGKLEQYLFLPESQLDELFTIFAEESGVSPYSTCQIDISPISGNKALL